MGGTRSVVSKKTFASLDDYLWQLTYKWACRSHPGKPEHWVARRYFGRFNPSRRNKWVFGDAASGAYLPYLAWTPIIRHRKVTGRASPDDPALTSYWNQRRGKNSPRSTAAPCACSKGSTAAARSARTCSCTPTGSPTSRGMATVAPHHPQSDHQATHRRTRTSPRRMTPVSYTPTANTGQPARTARNRQLHPPEPPSGACLSRMRAPQVRF